MDRVNGLNWIDLGDGRRGFKGRNPDGTAGTEATAAWFNSVQEEILAPIEAAGLVADAGNRAQLALAMMLQRPNYVLGGGGANVITFALWAGITSYDQIVGMPIRVKFGFTATGACKVNAGGFGERDLVTNVGQAAGQREITAGGIGIMIYDGAVFFLVSSSSHLSGPLQSVILEAVGAGIWTAPAWASMALIDVYGATGGGGGAYSTSTSAAGGGGGGGAWCQLLLRLVAGMAYAYVIGAGGTRGNASGSNGGDGATTSFGGLLTALGGLGGLGGINGPAAGGAPGTATGGHINKSGTPGGSPIYIPGAAYMSGRGGSTPGPWSSQASGNQDTIGSGAEKQGGNGASVVAGGGGRLAATGWAGSIHILLF